jgi:hypothetical protein
MVIFYKELPQSFVSSTKAGKIAKGVSERKGKEVQGAILAKDFEWQARFKELAEQEAQFSNASCLDPESIVEVKTRITSYPSTTLLVSEKVAEPAPLAPPPFSQTSSHCVTDPSPSPRPENNEQLGEQSSPPW